MFKCTLMKEQNKLFLNHHNTRIKQLLNFLFTGNRKFNTEPLCSCFKNIHLIQLLKTNSFNLVVSRKIFAIVKKLR